MSENGIMLGIFHPVQNFEINFTTFLRNKTNKFGLKTKKNFNMN